MISSVSNLTPGQIIEHENGSLYRLVGYWTEPVLILDRIHQPDDADLLRFSGPSRVHVCVGSENARPLHALVRKP